MTEGESLLAGIADEPWEDAPRLVYADWLEDRGDPRAELIRLQVERARAPWGSAGVRSPREEQLVATHGLKWAEELFRLEGVNRSQINFHRGWPFLTTIRATDFLGFHQRYRQIAPQPFITLVVHRSVERELRNLLPVVHSNRFRTMHLIAPDGLRAPQRETLVLEDLTRFVGDFVERGGRSLGLKDLPLERRQWTELARGKNALTLEEIRLYDCQGLGVSELNAIMRELTPQSPSMLKLRLSRLGLGMRQLRTPDGVPAHLRSFELLAEPLELGPAWVRGLAAGGGLRELRLGRNIPLRTVEVITAEPGLRRLEELRLHVSASLADVLDVLRRAVFRETLRRLVFDHVQHRLVAPTHRFLRERSLPQLETLRIAPFSRAPVRESDQLREEFGHILGAVPTEPNPHYAIGARLTGVGTRDTSD